MWCGTGIRDKDFAIMLLVWCFWNKYFIVDYVFSDIICRFLSRFLIIMEILFFAIIPFSIITFLLFIFVLVVLWFLFPDYFLTVFLEMYRFVVVITFLYVCTFFMLEVFSFVPIFHGSCAGNFVLGFYVKEFFIFSWGFCLWSFVHSVKCFWKFVTNPLNS